MKLLGTSRHIKRDLQYGYTLIEVLLAVTIVTLILGFTSFTHSDSLAREAVRSERDLFAGTILMGARMRALEHAGGENQGIFIDTQKKEYVLFRGNEYNPGDSELVHIPFGSKGITLQTEDGKATIVFEALTAHVREGTGTYTISLGENALAVEVNSYGRINW